MSRIVNKRQRHRAKKRSKMKPHHQRPAAPKGKYNLQSQQVKFLEACGFERTTMNRTPGNTDWLWSFAYKGKTRVMGTDEALSWAMVMFKVSHGAAAAIRGVCRKDKERVAADAAE